MDVTVYESTRYSVLDGGNEEYSWYSTLRT